MPESGEEIALFCKLTPEEISNYTYFSTIMSFKAKAKI
jgi:hypothetical protein